MKKFLKDFILIMIPLMILGTLSDLGYKYLYFLTFVFFVISISIRVIYLNRKNNEISKGEKILNYTIFLINTTIFILALFSKNYIEKNYDLVKDYYLKLLVIQAVVYVTVILITIFLRRKNKK